MRVEASYQAGQQAVAVDGKESRGAKRGGMPRVHLLGSVVHALRMLVAQQRVENTTTEVRHVASLLEPLPLRDVVITADALQTNVANTLYLRRMKLAHYLLPVRGNQPRLFALLDALPWLTTPVTAATQEHSHGRLETRTLRHLPMPAGHGMVDAARAVLVERSVTEWRGGAWRTRTEAVLSITSLAAHEATPADLLAHVRSHWTVEHTHWLRDVIWREDASLLRTGDNPQLWAAITNLVINMFRLLGVTRFTIKRVL
ncbi:MULTISPECIES: ISAs1 family transposase [unclassified Frankia]|uniref:ISAs1 family transposase n=1 Tax=unclassified Frankia TaxID=2632575 RepID=UPI001EF61F52|nr:MULTISPECIES: ISAs1 family transposase [unclassified Frankia]